MQSPRTSASQYPEIDDTFRFPTSQPAAFRPETDDAYLLRLCLDLKLDALLLTLGAAAADPVCAPDAPARTHGTHPDTHPGTDWEADQGTHPGTDRDAHPDTHPGTDPETVPDDHAPEAVVDRLIDLTTDPPSLQYTVREPADRPGPAPGPVPLPPWQRWLREDVEMARALARELLSRGGGLPASMGHTGRADATLAVLDRLEAFHEEMRALLAEAQTVAGTMAGTVRSDGLAAGRAAGRAGAVARHCRRRLGELDLLRLEIAALQAEPAGAPTPPSGLPGEFLG